MTMRVTIVGSRSDPRPDLVGAFVADLPDDKVVVSGGARRVDSIAEEVAMAHSPQTLIFHADRENLGRKAGPIRNEQIIAHCDCVIIDPNGEPIDRGYALGFAEEQGTFESIAVGERAARIREAGGA